MSKPVIRQAQPTDFEGLLVLYRQLHPDDVRPEDGSDRHAFNTILESPHLHLFVAAADDTLVASIYLNIIPNITRNAAPYAIIENVITHDQHRLQGIGRQIMSHTLEFAWRAGCYKAMLQTGSKREAIHAFYRACGFNNEEKAGFLARPP